MSHMYLVHAFPLYFPNIHSVLSCHLCLGFLSGLLTSGFRTKILYVSLISPMRATCPAHLICLYYVTQVLFGLAYIYEAPHYTVFNTQTLLHISPHISIMR